MKVKVVWALARMGDVKDHLDVAKLYVRDPDDLQGLEDRVRQAKEQLDELHAHIGEVRRGTTPKV